MRALRLAWISFFAFSAFAAEPPCSRTFRVAGDLNSTTVNGSEEAWFNRFLQDSGCEAVWIGSDISSRRRQQLLSAGELDVVLSATRTVEREQIAYFSQPYRQETFYFVRLSRTRELATIDDYLTEKYFLVMPRFGVYPDTVEQLRQRFNQHHLLVEYKDSQQGVALLQRQPRSIMLVFDLSYDAFNPQPDLQRLPWQLQGNWLHVMFARASTQNHDVERFDSWAARHPFRR